MYCENCGVSLKESDTFCAKCGAKVTPETENEDPENSSCENCGADLKGTANFCTKCGEKIPGGYWEHLTGSAG